MVSWGDDSTIYALLSLRGVVAVPGALFALTYTVRTRGPGIRVSCLAATQLQAAFARLAR